MTILVKACLSKPIPIVSKTLYKLVSVSNVYTKSIGTLLFAVGVPSYRNKVLLFASPLTDAVS